MANHLSVFHNRDPVCKIEHIMNIMADQENSDAFFFQLLDQIAKDS